MPDIRTLILTSTMMGLFCTGLLALLWLQNRKRFVGIGFWLADFVMTGLAIALEALRGKVPDFLSILVANILVFWGIILFYIGVQRFIGKPQSQVHNYILLAFFVLVHTWFTYFYPSLLARNINASVAILIYSFQIAWFILRQPDADLSFAMRSLGVIFIFSCLGSVGRIITDLFFDPGADFFKSSSVAWAFLAYQMLQVTITLCLFLQINHRLILRLEDDISQRKQVERSLENSERHYHSLFENMLDGFAYCKVIYIHGKPDDFICLEVNDAFEKLTSLNNVRGGKASEIMPGIRESNPELFEIYGRVALTGKSEQFEVYVAALDRWFLVSVYSTQPEYFIVVFKNITEPKQMVDALKASQKMAEALYESAPDALVTVNAQGRITHVNSQTQVMLGYAVDELLNQPIEMLVQQPLRDKHKQNRDDFFSHPRIRDMGVEQVLSIIRKDGGLVPVEIKLSPLQTGQEMLVTANIRDISDRIEREQRLHQIQLQMIEQQRTLASFDERQRMARDLHDSVSQSIHSLVLFSETLTATLEKGNVYRAIEISQRIQQSARQAIKETRLLLYQPEPSKDKHLNLFDELNNRLENIEIRAGVRAHVVLEGSLEHCPTHLHDNLFWIVIEALNNSLKHAQASSVQVTIRCFPTMMELEVLDDGKGFDTAQTHRGGYGLRNMHQRAVLAGGHLTVLSSQPGGTHVSFHIDIED